MTDQQIVAGAADALNKLSKLVTFFNGQKGFTDGQGPVNIDRYLLMVHRELGEAHEELRDGHGPTEIYMQAVQSQLGGTMDTAKPCGFPVELADAIIRLLDLAGRLNIPIGTVIEQKLAFNQTRPPKHGRRF